MSIRLEEIRLKRAFGAALVAVFPSLALGACGHDSTLADSADAQDATQNDHAITTADGMTMSAEGEAVSDATDASCAVAITLIDSGIDGDAYADPGCTYVNSCGVPSGVETIGCQVYIQSGEAPDVLIPNGCWVADEAGCMEDVYTPAGPFIMICPDCTSSGRGTAGIARCERHSHDTIGGFFAAMARSEATSVHAFARLLRELAHHGAPRSILVATERAERDEMRHARVMTRLATARGALVRHARAKRSAPRGLFAVARENAVEGCTREAFGALLMHARARLTTDAALARVFARIARDETRHAALSFRIARWAEPRLSRSARARVHEARLRAMETLENAVHARSQTIHDALLGYPRAAEARALASVVRRLPYAA